jgi:hypothetical protein
MRLPGQAEAVSAVLVSAIVIGIAGSVYFWGIPLIQKSRDVSVLENGESFMLLVDQKIKYIAAAGGRENIRIFEPGTVKFSGGKISYEVSTDGTIYATDASIPIGKTKNCNDMLQGDFLLDNSAVLCVTSSQISTGKFINTYDLSYRSMKSDRKIYKINLSGQPSSGGMDQSLIIQNNGVTETTENGNQVMTLQIDVKIE